MIITQRNNLLRLQRAFHPQYFLNGAKCILRYMFHLYKQFEFVVENTWQRSSAGAIQELGLSIQPYESRHYLD